MGAPKYQEKQQIKLTEKEEVEQISGNINNLLKDPKKLQKAIQIIEEMIREGSSEK
jgi:hypothetical protein